MKAAAVAVVGAVLAAGAAVAGLAGRTDWTLGLAAGGVLGALSGLWIRRSVAAAMTRGGAAKRMLFVHSLLRLATAAAVVVVALKLPAVSLFGVLVGYTALLLPTAGIRKPSGNGNRS